MDAPNKFCPSCGGVVPAPTDLFCRGCGKTLGAPAPPPAPPRAASRAKALPVLGILLGALLLVGGGFAVFKLASSGGGGEKPRNAEPGPLGGDDDAALAARVEVRMPVLEANRPPGVRVIASPPPTPAGYGRTGPIYDIEVAVDGDMPAIVRLPLPEDAPGEDSSTDYSIGRHDGAEWHMYPARREGRMVEAEVDHFSPYGIFRRQPRALPEPGEASRLQIGPPWIRGLRINGEEAWADLDLGRCRWAHDPSRPLEGGVSVDRLRVLVALPDDATGLTTARDQNFVPYTLQGQAVVLDPRTQRQKLPLALNLTRPLNVDPDSVPQATYAWRIRFIPVFADGTEGPASPHEMIPAGIAEGQIRALRGLASRLPIDLAAELRGGALSHPYYILYNRGLPEVYNDAMAGANRGYALWYSGEGVPFIGMSGSSQWHRVVMHEWGHYAAHMIMGDEWFDATPSGYHRGWMPASSTGLAWAEDLATLLGQWCTGQGLPDAGGAMIGQWTDYSRNPEGDDAADIRGLWPNNRDMDAPRVEAISATILSRLSGLHGFARVMALVHGSRIVDLLDFFSAWVEACGERSEEAAGLQEIFLDEGVVWPVRGRVVAQRENPDDPLEGISDVRVRARTPTEKELGSGPVRTDADGWFRIALPPGLLLFELEKDGWRQVGIPTWRIDTDPPTNGEPQRMDPFEMREMKRPKVTITSPAEGAVVTERVLTVTGTVEGTKDGTEVGVPIDRATIHLGGETFETIVSGGRFSQAVLLSPGPVTIRVVARNALGDGEASVRIQADIERTILKVVLTWVNQGTDVDLWVTDPEGFSTGYNRRRPAEGRELDIDDTDGLGPETYTITRHVPGDYAIRINYFRGQPVERFTVRWTMFEGTTSQRSGEWTGALSDADGNGDTPAANKHFAVRVP